MLKCTEYYFVEYSGEEMNNKNIKALLLFMLSLVFLSSCSIKKIAMNSVANAMTGEGSSTVFTGDNDPELVADALPFAIKMYETLLNSVPEHRGLILQTGSLYIMYANAFLYVPASMLSDEEHLKQEFLMKRAKNLYLRGRDLILKGLNKKYPGFLSNLKNKKYKLALSEMKKEDVPFLYWSAAGWLGAFAIDPFDMKFGITLPGAAALMKKVNKLDSSFMKGAIHEFYISYYGSLPEYMGGNKKKARFHYEKAIKFSENKSTSPLISYASTVLIDEQNLKEFRSVLNKVKNFKLDTAPENMLVNTLNLRKAKWLLNHIDDLFVETDMEEKE